MALRKLRPPRGSRALTLKLSGPPLHGPTVDPDALGFGLFGRDFGRVIGVSGLYRLACAVMAALADQLKVARVVREVRTQTNRPDVI